jgi:hypothetical protein
MLAAVWFVLFIGLSPSRSHRLMIKPQRAWRSFAFV